MSLSKAVIALLVGWYLASKGYGAFGLLYGLIIGLLIPTINNIYREWRKINFTFFVSFYYSEHSILWIAAYSHVCFKLYSQQL